MFNIFAHSNRNNPELALDHCYQDLLNFSFLLALRKSLSILISDVIQINKYHYSFVDSLHDEYFEFSD